MESAAPHQIITSLQSLKDAGALTIEQFERVEAAYGKGIPEIFEELTGFEFTTETKDGEPVRFDPKESRRRALASFRMGKAVKLVAGVSGHPEADVRSMTAAQFRQANQLAVQIFVDAFTIYSGQEPPKPQGAEGNGSQAAGTSP